MLAIFFGFKEFFRWKDEEKKKRKEEKKKIKVIKTMNSCAFENVPRNSIMMCYA